MSERVLSTRQLNRALLDRQLLLERSSGSLTGVLEQVAGLQTQYAPSGYVGLWSRLRDFTRPMLTRALEQRRAVQATLMRVTIHTVSAADYWPMAIALRRPRREWWLGVVRQGLGETDMEEVARVVRKALANGPLRQTELAATLRERGYPSIAWQGAGLWVDLVRVPPSGTWERRRADLFGLAEDWLPSASVTEEAGLELLVRRYFAAFGPAPMRDLASWAGMKVETLRPVAERLATCRFRDEAGGELLDLPDRPIPDEDAAAPVRFLPTWDATLLVQARRTQILPEKYRARIFNTKTPHSLNTYLVDGQVAGTWRYADGRIELEPLSRLRAADRRALEREAEGLVELHQP